MVPRLWPKASGEGDSPRVPMWKEPLTPTLSPQERGEGEVEAGEFGHGAVSIAIQWSGRADPARPRAAAARPTDVRLSAMGAFARNEPRLPHAVGADLALRRPDPRRLPPPAAPLRRGYRGRPLL